MTNTHNKHLSFRFLSAVTGMLLILMISLAGPVPAQDPEPAEALFWPLPNESKAIDLFRQGGVPSGTVELYTQHWRMYHKWGQDSTVTWSLNNSLAGQVLPVFTYESGEEISYTLEVEDERFEGVLKPTREPTRHELPALALSRVGIVRIALSVRSERPENSFRLRGFTLEPVAGDLTLSKPVLIAGGAWLKIQASLRVNPDLLSQGEPAIRGTITPWPGGDVLWEGAISAKAVAGGFEIDHTVSNLQPERWSPDAPNLYLVTLDVTAGDPQAQTLRVQSRVGFRDFESKDGRFYLNGQPVFMRGNAIMPPGSGHVRNLNPALAHDPDAVRKYLLYLKEQNVNLVRAQDPLWLSIADEVGMMGFVGRYGVPHFQNATRYRPPTFDESAVTYYQHLFAEEYMNHPSVMIWVLTNETPKPGIEVGDQYLEFLRQVYERLVEWDPTRAYISNTGFGLGQTGDVNSFHAYLGWYNGLAQSAYKFREDYRSLIGLDAPQQPMIFTETVGVYIDELGRMPAMGKQVAASVMWAGNDADVPETAMGYQAYLAKELIEILRRIRSENPDIAGLTPFTSTARDWTKSESFEEIPFLPMVTESYPVAYQPVLLSFDNRWPHVYAGTTVRMPVHLVNDAEDGRALASPLLSWRLIQKATDEEVSSGTLPFAETVAYYATDARELVLEIPEGLDAGAYILRGEIQVKGRPVSANTTEIWVEPRATPELRLARRVNLYDPLGESIAVLENAGLVEGKDFHLTTSPFAAMRNRDALTGQELQEILAHEQIGGDLAAPSETLLIIGSKQWLEPMRDSFLLIREFIDRGGRVLFLHPNAMALNDIGIFKEIMVSENEWIGDRVSVDLESLWHTSRIFGAWINPRRSDTGIFADIDRRQLWLWSDPSDWSLSKEGLPDNEPVNRLLKLRDAEALGSTAVLANFGRGLEYLALAEVFRGDGSVLLSGFDFERFVGFDPIAGKVLRNIITYAADDQAHTLVPEAKAVTNIGSPSDEDGLVPCEFRNGLLLEYHQDEYQVRRIAGPFWFNRLCHTRLIDPENKLRNAFLHVRPPEGTTEAVFRVRRVKTNENRGRYTPEELTISLGDTRISAIIPGEEEVEVRVPLPEDREPALRFDFAGTSDMGISTMSFE